MTWGATTFVAQEAYIEALPLGAILDCRSTRDQGEALQLVGNLEVVQSLIHQVSNANSTNFPLLHRVI
jgi:hypothetical protein